MSQSMFDLIEQAVGEGGSQAAFELLLEKFREEKNYALLFDALLMKKRHQLGLPLVWAHSSAKLSGKQRSDYETAYVEAARQVGNLFLAEGDIPGAWTYFHAIGEGEPVVRAIEKFEPRPTDDVDAIIEIAFAQGVLPSRGFQLILQHQGVCRAISALSQYPVREGRDESACLLIRQLYDDLVESLKRAITRTEGKEPETGSLRSLISERGWLFEGQGYHIDTSHLASVVRFSLETSDQDSLSLALELTEYGQRLASMFQYKDHPPFEDGYTDYAVYLKALMGREVDGAVAHFRRKVREVDLSEVGTYPAQVLVELLSRLERYPEAVEISLQYLRDVNPGELACPTAAQLCQLAGDYRKLMEIAREQSDLLEFTAGVLQHTAV